MDLKNSKYFYLNFFLLNFIFFLVVIFFFNFHGTHNVDVFLKWLQSAVDEGFINNYKKNNNDNYGPLATLFSYFLYNLTSFFLKDINLSLVLKLTQIIFFYCSVIIIYLYKKNIINSILFIIIFSTTALGHQDLDIIYCLFFLIAFYFLKNKNIPIFCFFYLLAIIVKWQPIIVVPILIIYISDFYLNFFNIKLTLKNLNYKNILQASLIVLIFVSILFIIFDFSSFYKSLGNAVNNERLAGNSFNFNWICTWILQIINQDYYGQFNGTVRYIYIEPYHLLKFLGSIIFFCLLIYFLLKFSLKEKKNFEDLLIYIFFIFYSYFMFNKGTSQNHLFSTCFFAFIIYLNNKDYFFEVFFTALFFNLNLILMYGFDGEGLLKFSSDYRLVNIPFFQYPLDLTVVISFLNIIIFIVIFNRNRKRL